MKIQQASELNQHGANRLALGDYQGAYRLFAQAVTILRDARVVDEDHEGGSWSSFSAAVGQRLVALDGSDMFIFNQDFQFRAAAALTTGQKNLCVAIVLFNMALGSHGQAKRLGKNAYLERAMALYSRCLRCLQQLHGISECVNVLAIATLNNMAEVVYDLGDIYRAKELLEHAKPLASTLSPAATTLNRVDEYFMNMMIMEFTKTARCA